MPPGALGIGAQQVHGQGLREFDEIGIAFEVGVAPVSYTHLDVYKRQPTGRW